MFRSKRPSSGHHYRNFKIRYNTEKLGSFYEIPYDLTKVIGHKIYINLRKVVGLVNSWPVIVPGLCIDFYVCRNY
jgi:hypothetical protein